MLVEVFALVFFGAFSPSAALITKAEAEHPLGTSPSACSCPGVNQPSSSVSKDIKDTMDESKAVRRLSEEIKWAERELKHLGWKHDRVVEYQSNHEKQLKQQIEKGKTFATALAGKDFRTEEYFQTRLCALYARAAVLHDKDALMAARYVCMGRTKLSLSTQDTTHCPCSSRTRERSAAIFLSRSDPKPSEKLEQTLKDLKEKIATAKKTYWEEPDKWKAKLGKLDQDEATFLNTTLQDYQKKEGIEEEARNSVLKKVCPYIESMDTAEAACGSIDGLLGLKR